MYDQASGAFTGEVSAAMLLDVGCRYVILGHSERRQLLGETDEAVNRKTKAALAAGLIPIVCVGELLAERESGQTAAVIRPAVRRFAGGYCRRRDGASRHRLRAGLGHWHRQSRHAGTGPGGP